MVDWLSEARKKVEETVEAAEDSDTVVGDTIARAREDPRTERIYETLEERSDVARETVETLREEVRTDSEAAALLVTQLAAEYRDDPERARADLSAALEGGVETATMIPRAKADGLARGAGWTDFEEFRQAEGYTAPEIDVHKDLGSPYDQFFDAVEEATWDADDLARYDLPAPDELDLSLGSTDRAALEDAVGAMGEAYCREHGLDAVDSVIYRVDEDAGAAVVTATLYDEG